MNRYFYSLHPNYQNYFIKFGFYPSNRFEADAFLRSVNHIDKEQTFYVELDSPILFRGVLTTKFAINKHNYLDAFYPEIWEQLNMKKKLLAVCFAFDQIVQSDVYLQKTKPQLVFGFSTDRQCNGLQYIKNDKAIVEIFMSRVLSKEDPVQLLTVIRHELYHAQQINKRNKIIQKIRANNKRGISNQNLTADELAMISTTSGSALSNLNDFVRNSNRLKNVNVHESQQKFIAYWDKIKDMPDWRILLEIFYFLDANESSAFNKQYHYEKSVRKYFHDNFDDYCYNVEEDMFARFSFKECVDYLNENYGYNLSNEDVSEFMKLNQMLSNDIQKNQFGEYYVNNIDVNSPGFFNSAVWKALKIMMIVHNKKLVEKVPENIVETYRKKKIEAIDDEASWSC